MEGPDLHNTTLLNRKSDDSGIWPGRRNALSSAARCGNDDPIPTIPQHAKNDSSRQTIDEAYSRVAKQAPDGSSHRSKPYDN
jgi:hypothetical protein